MLLLPWWICHSLKMTCPRLCVSLSQSLSSFLFSSASLSLCPDSKLPAGGPSGSGHSSQCGTTLKAKETGQPGRTCGAPFCSPASSCLGVGQAAVVRAAGHVSQYTSPRGWSRHSTNRRLSSVVSNAVILCRTYFPFPDFARVIS